GDQTGEGKGGGKSFARADDGDGDKQEGAEDPGRGEVELVRMDEAVAAPSPRGVSEEEREEEAPREEPDQVQGPVEVSGEFVVIHRIAPAEEAEEVLIDEVEPE